MSFNKYFRVALFLPFIFPALLLALNYVFDLPEFFQWVWVSVALPIIFGGIPYAIFIYFVFTWSRHRSNSDIKKWMWKAPLIFLPIVILMLILMFPTSNYDEIWKSFLLIILSVFAYGYFYVVLTQCGWVIVKKLGWGYEEINDA